MIQRLRDSKGGRVVSESPVCHHSESPVCHHSRQMNCSPMSKCVSPPSAINFKQVAKNESTKRSSPRLQARSQEANYKPTTNPIALSVLLLLPKAKVQRCVGLLKKRKIGKM